MKINDITEGFSDQFYLPKIIAGDFPKYSEIIVNRKKNVLQISTGFFKSKIFYSFDEIKKVVDLGNDIRNKGQSTSGTVGRAALGGLAFGAAGAVIGGMTGKNEFSEYNIIGIIFNDGKKAKIKYENNTIIGNALENFLKGKIDLGFGDEEPKEPKQEPKQQSKQEPKEPKQEPKEPKQQSKQEPNNGRFSGYKL